MPGRRLLLACCLLLTSSVVLVLSNRDCLGCWDNVCRVVSDPSPNVCIGMSDCTNYNNSSCDLSCLFDNRETCCSEATGYVEQVFTQALAPPSTSSETCDSTVYNQQTPSQSLSNLEHGLSSTHQYLFPSIKFNCSGCLRNVTFYTNSPPPSTGSTIFNILLWGLYKNTSDNSSVYVQRPDMNFSIRSTRPLQFVPWGAGYEVTIPLHDYNICFETEYTFGISLPGRGNFMLDVFHETSSPTDITYKRMRANSCPALRSVWYTDGPSDGNVLIAAGVMGQELSQTTSALVSPSSSTSFSTSTNNLPMDTSMSNISQQKTHSLANIITYSTSLLGPYPTVNASPPITPQPMRITFVAVGLGGAVLIIILVAAILVGLCALHKHFQKGKFDLDSPERSSQALAPMSPHYEDIAHRDSSMINDYDLPLELDTRGSRGHLSMINERGMAITDYTDMSSGGPSPVHNDEHYQSPRSIPNSYLQGNDNNYFADYDNPSSILDNSQPTSNQRIYFELENPSKKDHDYHILDKPTQKSPLYHVLEPGYHVPGASEREQWAFGGCSQDSVTSTVFEQETSTFYEERPHYWEPGENPDSIYDQLSFHKCREIPREDLTFIADIGEGEFGTVSKEVWTLKVGGKMEVAVKKLKVDASQEERASFLREGARMMQFFHSNVVKLHGMVTVGEPPMLVVELMPKGDLRNYLKGLRAKKIPPLPGQLLKFGKDIALGMRHMTKKGFIHRDLAARNVLLNESMICKIGDFGMTRATDHVFDMNRVEQIPLRWTAPEAINHRQYSEKSDVYSFGMVLFEIWSLGHKPFTKHDNNMLLQFIKQGGIQSPPPGCPRGVYELMVNCWNPDYRRRQTFEDICEYLNVPDDSLLHWATQDTRISKKAMELGAEVYHGSVLYQDLQRLYRNDEQEDD